MFKISYRSFATHEDLQIAKRLGIDTVELIWVDHPCSMGREAEMLANVKDYGIFVNAVTSATGPDARALKSDIDFVKKAGATIYAPHAPNLTYDDKEGISNFLNVWNEVNRYAQDQGVTLCVQSCGQTPQSWDIIFSRIDGLGLKYDPSFSLQAGRSYASEIVKYGKLIKHVHVKDEVIFEQTTDFNQGLKPHRYVPAGMGDIRWGTVIALLYEEGYSGDLAIETHSAYWGSNMEKDLILSKRHLEQFLV
ncbi:MAG: sugar phosphate isomerase/epimerase [Oscillospiraceae bacterium]|nr:sugar phosphate isomerase/epimerase [Oscillospiraceae bacterium]